MLHLGDIHRELYVLRRRSRKDTLPHTLDTFKKIAGAFFELVLTGIHLRDLQHIIDQSQQALAGLRDLAQIFPQFLSVVHIPLGKIGKSDDGVHRRTHIMRHIGKKCIFGGILLPGMSKRTLRDPLLLHLAHDLFVYAPVTHDHFGYMFFLPYFDETQLQILRSPILNDAVIDVEPLFFRKPLPDRLCIRCRRQLFPVLRMNPRTDIVRIKILKRIAPALLTVMIFYLITDPIRLYPVLIQICIENRYIITAEPLDHDQTAYLLLICLF